MTPPKVTVHYSAMFQNYGFSFGMYERIVYRYGSWYDSSNGHQTSGSYTSSGYVTVYRSIHDFINKMSVHPIYGFVNSSSCSSSVR